jgi:DNA-binding CsgD family transcriptional regulator
MLEETITALKVLLRESAEAKEELEEKVLANVKELIFPFIIELESTLNEKSQKVYLDTIKKNLTEITSSFTKKLSSLYDGLTPREIQIADFIRQGKSNKEMAYLLKISVSSVDFHRRNLRKKLNIKGKKIKLRITYRIIYIDFFAISFIHVKYKNLTRELTGAGCWKSLSGSFWLCKVPWETRCPRRNRTFRMASRIHPAGTKIGMEESFMFYKKNTQV